LTYLYTDQCTYCGCTLHTSTTLVVTVPICEWDCSCVQNKVCTFRSGKLRNGKPKSTQLTYGGRVFAVRHFSNTVSFGCPGPNQMLAQGATEGASWGKFYFINLVATTLVLGKTKEAGCCWWLAHAVKTVADPGYGIKRCLYFFYVLCILNHFCVPQYVYCLFLSPRVISGTLVNTLKILGPNFEHFWVANWPKLLITAGTLRQDINKCWNIGPRGCKLASQMWWYLFLSLGADTKAIKFSIY